ncbi:uncharacterized protein CTHT_0017290 [Thermochaetoides thermophila DSM 1495]|uniref:RNA polymerase II-associated protein RBA50 n=1 Tax=Chaetomium thermophilum (strain DSM 1495 / CBS 144.50 / IMI 039719) TaxID=759272 RepID=G0S2H9_CHATD|nr:hypothetical protein CTHT_0017290 [Thermochaetoides thermophila DSM 1495]EGS22212.1 hypothetical protein CTHT_0017290 [Thermochaetoides thermophila DSM 1495]
MESTLEVFDVQERDISEITPPSFPQPSAPSVGGYPPHKKRVSAFKQRQAKASAAKEQPKSPESSLRNNAWFDERRGIHEENQALLDSMTPEQIEETRRQLFGQLDPNFIQSLLRRARIDEPTIPEPIDAAAQESKPSSATGPQPKARQVTVEDAPDEVTAPKAPEKQAETSMPMGSSSATNTKPSSAEPAKPKKTVTFDEDAAPLIPPEDLFPAANPPPPTKPSTKKIARPEERSQLDDADNLSHSHKTHFPRPPRVPDLDPNDPNFLENLHKKYFPDLPADPSKLAWMAPIPTPDSDADKESPYYPGQDSLPISALRFDFRGALLPPRVSRTIPVTKGLHHHGEAPEAAGYTIPELARLARSAVPGQRCLAYQTLGRILYRLGIGEFGTGEGGRNGEDDDLAFALWRLFQEGRIIEILEWEAGQPDGKGHLSAKAYATEALWLFEKGGWKERWKGR